VTRGVRPLIRHLSGRLKLQSISLIISFIAFLFGIGILFRYRTRALVLVELKGAQDLPKDKEQLTGMDSFPHLLVVENKGRQNAEDVSVIVKGATGIGRFDHETNEEPDRISVNVVEQKDSLRVHISQIRRQGYVKVRFHTSELNPLETQTLIGKGTLISPSPSKIPKYIQGIAATWIASLIFIAIPTLIKGWEQERDIWLFEPSVFFPLSLALIGGISLALYSKMKDWRR
jgi:hypothetical protein